MFIKPVKTLTFFMLLVCTFPSMLNVLVSALVLEQDWIYNYINEPPFGNWTFTKRLAVPMRINSSQIAIGANWTYIYTLAANQTYHVYCYGDWVEEGSTPLTDYDIYVYNPFGELEGYHTEAAGLPEHLGTTVEEPFFTPKYSGNYSIVIRNDPRESQAADSATLMTIEHVGTNIWHSCAIEGKQGNMSLENTSRAYEFTTSSKHIEIQIQVPATLDMYEARLYLMMNPADKELLNGVPLAWELGLYGESGDSFGGYNLESKGFRGEAYASCEYHGQDMLINYTTLLNMECLYHLVFIGETGSGNLSFRIKTDFGNSALQLATPIQMIYPNNETVINVVSNNSNIQQAFLHYSTDNWNHSNILEMDVDNKTSNASIPGQEAGSTVSYRVEAFDLLDNLISLDGNYTVKHPTFVSISLGQETVTIGENISLRGFVRPASGSADALVKLLFSISNGTTVTKYCSVIEGNFSANFRPSILGSWAVQAEFIEDPMRHGSIGDIVYFNVLEPPFFIKYSMFIYAGIGVAVAVVVVILLIRRRQS